MSVASVGIKSIGVHVVVVLTLLLIVGLATMSATNLIVLAQNNDNDADQPAIGDVSLSGSGYIAEQHEIVRDHPERNFVWRTGQLNVSANITAGEVSGEFTLCARAYTEDGERLNMSDCSTIELEEKTETIGTVSLPDWPEDTRGNHSIMIELRSEVNGETEVFSEAAVEVIVIEREGDLTGDGLSNEAEVEHGTDFTVPDTIGNGLTDWEEVRKYGTDPLSHDTTGDGIDDATLVRFGLDPTEPYLAHQYALVGLILVLIIVGVTVFGRRRLSSITSFFEGIGLLHQPTSQSGRSSLPTNVQTAPDLDDSILTNEEYITQLLRQNGGRMKQRQIVESTDWSKAKVSRVLSKLEGHERIRKVPVGRENVIELLEE